MIKQLKIHYFGCSFTDVEKSNTKYVFKNYRHIVDKKFGVPSINHSKSGKSNQHIFDDVYNMVKKSKEDEHYNHLFIIQTTFNDRLGMMCDISNNSFVSMCKSIDAENYTDAIHINFYNDWLRYFYSKSNALYEYKKQIEFISAFLKQNNIKYIIVGIDEGIDNIDESDFFEMNNFILFEKTYSFYKFSILNKLRISDITENNINGVCDYHFNIDGHNLLASKIIEQILKMDVL